MLSFLQTVTFYFRFSMNATHPLGTTS